MKIVKVALLLPLMGLSADGAGRGCAEAVPAIEPQRFRSVGFGTSAEEWATVGQNQLLAIRTAKLDAYRTMAEQVYGFRLTGSTTVSSMMVKSDQFRIYVDAVIRGAEVVSVQPIGSDVYEVVLEMRVNLPIEDSESVCVEPTAVMGIEGKQPFPDFLTRLFEILNG